MTRARRLAAMRACQALLDSKRARANAGGLPMVFREELLPGADAARLQGNEPAPVMLDAYLCDLGRAPRKAPRQSAARRDVQDIRILEEPCVRVDSDIKGGAHCIEGR